MISTAVLMGWCAGWVLAVLAAVIYEAARTAREAKGWDERPVEPQVPGSPWHDFEVLCLRTAAEGVGVSREGGELVQEARRRMWEGLDHEHTPAPIWRLEWREGRASVSILEHFRLEARDLRTVVTELQGLVHVMGQTMLIPRERLSQAAIAEVLFAHDGLRIGLSKEARISHELRTGAMARAIVEYIEWGRPAPEEKR